MVRPDWSLPVNQIAVGSIRLFVTEVYVVCEILRRCKCVFLKTMGCQASRHLTRGILHGLSTEIVAFLFFFFFFQDIARF